MANAQRIEKIEFKSCMLSHMQKEFTEINLILLLSSNFLI